MKKRSKIILYILLGIILIIAGIIIYALFYYTSVCNTQACFDNSLVNCMRTSFLKAGTDSVIGYTIIGKTLQGTCEVNVKMVQIKKGDPELSSLEGQDMLCYPVIGLLTQPEKDLSICSGLLKESIQQIIIKRLHAQIVENLGQINENSTNII